MIPSHQGQPKRLSGSANPFTSTISLQISASTDDRSELINELYGHRKHKLQRTFPIGLNTTVQDSGGLPPEARSITNDD